jgi:hypothetical protein
MTAAADPHGAHAGLMLIEGGLALLVAAIAFGWPTLGATWFAAIERAFARLARRRGWSIAAVGLTALLLRLAILPVCPVPHPFVPDDFSFLLAGQTFAAGRLTNPTPALWTHFESIHITMQPTYMSMYFPGTGLVLAAGQVLAGNPWAGVLCANALMCAVICWMLQAWLPPGWALLGGMLAVLRLALFSYWVNTYSAAGVVAALGGALVLGAMPRLLRRPQLRYSLLLAVGAIVLAATRPYEGLLLCLPVAVAVGRGLFGRKTRPKRPQLLRLSVAPLLLIVAAGGWMGYYNHRAFGSALTLPYTVNRSTYAMAPYFVWQAPRPEPVYRHAAMRRFYRENELEAYGEMRRGFVPWTTLKLARGILFFAGLALLWPLLMIAHVLRDRRIRFLLVCMLVMSAGMLAQVFLIAHYVAPFTAAFYALGLQAMRHLRLATADGRPFGLGLVRMTVALCVLLAGVRLLAGPLRLSMPEWPASEWTNNWYGPLNFGGERAAVEARLEQLSGKQLVLVRYGCGHNPLDEWVYNGPDIDGSQVIWAREMDDAANLELMRYYRDRDVWLVEPDVRPVKVSSYVLPQSHAKNVEAVRRSSSGAGLY